MAYWLILGPVGVLLEGALLLQGFRGHTFRKHYLFYSYIVAVFLGSIVVIAVKFAAAGSYEKWYWPLQITTLVLGYGILLEVLNNVLKPYPGAERFARYSGIAAFGLIFCFALIAPRIMPHWSPGTVIEFERDLRCVQALFIWGLLAVVFYYGIPMGKNMKGMVIGYGLYILTSLMSLAVRAYAGAGFDKVWDIVQPLSFDASLLIWLVALWSYCPNPAPDHTIHLEEDYEALVARTKSVMGAIRAHLEKAARA
jgi:hypothetical protein